MIGREIHEHEDRRLRRLLVRKRLQGLIEIELVGLHVLIDAHVRHVDEPLDADTLLERPRAEEVAIGRIERDGLVAAALQRLRQAALDPVRGDPRDVELQIAERAHRHAGQDIELGVPGRAARRLRDHGPLLAVDGLEEVGIARRHLDAGRGRDVETRLVEQHDDMRPLCSGIAFFVRRQRRPARGMRARSQAKRAARRRIGLDPSGRRQPRHRDHARARETGNMIDALERLPRLLGHRDRHRRHRYGRCGKNRQHRAATDAERIGAPDRPQQRNRNHCRHDQLRPQLWKHREQERKRIAIDDQEIEERQGQLQNVELEARQHDQQHHQNKRQRRGDARPRQHQQEQAIHKDPRQQRERDPKKSVFRGEQDSQGRKMQRGDHADTGIEPDAARCAIAGPACCWFDGGWNAALLFMARGFSRNRRRSGAG